MICAVSSKKCPVESWSDWDFLCKMLKSGWALLLVLLLMLLFKQNFMYQYTVSNDTVHASPLSTNVFFSVANFQLKLGTIIQKTNEHLKCGNHMGTFEIKSAEKRTKVNVIWIQIAWSRKREDRHIWMLYIYDPCGIYGKVFPIPLCDCLDLLRLYQLWGRDVVKGTTSICSEILCWLWMRACLSWNLFGCRCISHNNKKCSAIAIRVLFLKQVQYCTMWGHETVCLWYANAKWDANEKCMGQAKKADVVKFYYTEETRSAVFTEGSSWMIPQIHLKRIMMTLLVTQPVIWQGNIKNK